MFSLSFQSPADNFFSSDPFKPSGSGSDTKKSTNNSQDKDSLSSVKDPFSNPFGPDPFGQFIYYIFCLFLSLSLSLSLIYSKWYTYVCFLRRHWSFAKFKLPACFLMYFKISSGENKCRASIVYLG